MKAKTKKTWLQRRLKRVRVHSCADGSFGIEAQWLAPYVVIEKDEPAAFGHREMPPGLFTRMTTAEELELILNRALRTSDQQAKIKGDV